MDDDSRWIFHRGRLAAPSINPAHRPINIVWAHCYPKRYRPADSTNQGTISFDPTSTSVGYRDFFILGFPVVGTAYATFSDFTGPNDGGNFTQGRIYSVQFDSLDSSDPSAAPEPSSLAMMFAGAFAVIASKHLR
jgi:hypothetical protein